MQEECICVSFEQKVLGGCREEHVPFDPQHLVDEFQLFGRTADIFDHGVAEYPTKLLIRKREMAARISNEPLAREETFHTVEVLDSQSGVILRVILRILEEIVAGRRSFF